MNSILIKIQQKFFKALWDLSEWSGVGFHRLGISAPYIFSKAFGLKGKKLN